MNRPFQFTISRVLLATFWMAVCFASATALWMAVRDGTWVSDYLGWPLLFGALESPFLAIGSLVGRTQLWAIIGIVAFFPLAIAVLPSLH